MAACHLFLFLMSLSDTTTSKFQAGSLKTQTQNAKAQTKAEKGTDANTGSNRDTDMHSFDAQMGLTPRLNQNPMIWFRADCDFGELRHAASYFCRRTIFQCTCLS